MTRRDYELLARTLREDNAPAHTVGAIARALQRDNPRFDVERFMAAAGLLKAT